MFQRNKLAGVVAGVVLAVGATAASATTIDFTKASTGTSGTAGNVGWTLTAGTNVGIAGTANNSQLFDGQGSNLASTGLALQRDGYGVRSALDKQTSDDEISSMKKGSEYLQLTFDWAVKLTGASFLDLFIAANGDFEEGYAETDDGTIIAFSAADLANSGGSRRAGYAGGTFAGIITQSIKFYIGLGNDAQGVADGALASVDIAPVPVPAAGLLMLGGLGGLAALRRRKTA
jgi:hypothetical protein